MKVLFCAYRDWALMAGERIKELFREHTFVTVRTPKELELLARPELGWDVIITVGWSWKVPADVVNGFFVVGMHPSDLPKYAGGSPIQHQIVAGERSSMATLFKLNERFDEGEIVAKVPYSLEGHLDEVLRNISVASTELLCGFLMVYPNVTLTKQEPSVALRRLKPEDSRVGPVFKSPTSALPLTCRELWDAIRCHEDPYPNVFFEDETGKLVIKRVEFEPK